MKKARSLQLVIGAVILLFLGLIYGWSVFVTPLEAEFGWKRSETSLAFTFSMIFFCLGGFLSGILLRKRSHRFVLRISAALLLLGFFLSSRVQSLGGIYFSYGVLCGGGVGIGYNAVLGTVAKWFPDKPGFCSGMLLLGFGVGALLLGTGASSLIAAMGWRTTFLIFAALFAIVIVVGAQLLRLPHSAEREAIQALIQSPQQPDAPKSLTPQETIRKPSFWILFVWALLLSLVGLAIIGQAVPVALEIGIATALATTISGMISVCNGLNRLITGAVFDRFGQKKTMLLDTALFLVATPALYLALRGKSLVLLIAGFVLLGLAYGGVPTILSASVNRMYGPKHYALNYSIMNFEIMPGALIGPLITSSMQQSSGSYTSSCLVLFAICIPAVLLALILPRASK